MSISCSPELLILKPLETVGRAGERGAGERTNEIVGVFDAGDASTMARSSETSRSRRSFMRVNLEQQMRARQKMEVVSPPDTLVLNAEDVLEVRLEFIG
jgi:hypothetical protein